MDTTTDPERELAADVAKRAMISGWTKAIDDVAKERSITQAHVRQILDAVSKENPNRDPSMRIDELADWEAQKMRNSEVKRDSLALDRMSPGLRAYMERKRGSV